MVRRAFIQLSMLSKMANAFIDSVCMCVFVCLHPTGINHNMLGNLANAYNVYVCVCLSMHVCVRASPSSTYKTAYLVCWPPFHKVRLIRQSPIQFNDAVDLVSWTMYNGTQLGTSRASL